MTTFTVESPTKAFRRLQEELLDVEVEDPGSWQGFRDSARAFLAKSPPTEPAQILRYASFLSQIAHAVEVAQRETAVAWALANPPIPVEEQIDELADFPITIGGPGAPEFRGGTADTFSIATGKGLGAGFTFIQHAGEMVFRLPWVWETVREKHVPMWRVDQLARLTKDLPLPVVKAVERELAGRFHLINEAQMKRCIAEARSVHDPEGLAREQKAELDDRYITIDRRNKISGVCGLFGELSTPDAEALEATLDKGAELLQSSRFQGESLQVLRATALGMIARGEIAVTPHAQGSQDTQSSQEQGAGGYGLPTITTSQIPLPAADVVLYVHLDQKSIITDGRRGTGVAEVESLYDPVTVEQVAQWCGADAKSIKVVPVMDLSEEITSSGYSPSGRLAEQIILRDRTCVFPGCTRRARRCDKDHITPYGEGGQTTSSNLAALCRRHHRMKTRREWEYIKTGDTYTWVNLDTPMPTLEFVLKKGLPRWWKPKRIYSFDDDEPAY